MLRLTVESPCHRDCMLIGTVLLQNLDLPSSNTYEKAQETRAVTFLSLLRTA